MCPTISLVRSPTVLPVVLSYVAGPVPTYDRHRRRRRYRHRRLRHLRRLHRPLEPRYTYIREYKGESTPTNQPRCNIRIRRIPASCRRATRRTRRGSNPPPFGGARTEWIRRNPLEAVVRVARTTPPTLSLSVVTPIPPLSRTPARDQR